MSQDGTHLDDKAVGPDDGNRATGSDKGTKIRKPRQRKPKSKPNATLDNIAADPSASYVNREQTENRLEGASRSDVAAKASSGRKNPGRQRGRMKNSDNGAGATEVPSGHQDNQQRLDTGVQMKKSTSKGGRQRKMIGGESKMKAPEPFGNKLTSESGAETLGGFPTSNEINVILSSKAGDVHHLDLGSRVHHELSNGTYDCMICFESVSRKHRIWSCNVCWAVIHLQCISRWASRTLNETNQHPSPEHADQADRIWRCPGCKTANKLVPKVYKCWCSQVENPQTNKYFAPHSCGQTCGKQRPNGCPHVCTLLCHAGPCAPCSALGPIQYCHCGKTKSQKRCTDTDYENGYSCEQECGELMPCGIHTCKRKCHDGLCGACNVVEQVSCYCGKKSRAMACSERDEARESAVQNPETQAEQSWTGFWDCYTTCGRQYSCGVHRCQRRCHAQDCLPSECPWSPSVLRTCPCGKAPIETLEGGKRSTCSDKIPICSSKCSTRLSCGHSCEQTCHLGECPPCLRKVKLPCYCGSTEVESSCLEHQSGTKLRCSRNCGTMMSCGRHTCREQCCPGYLKAKARIASRPKGRASKMIMPSEEYEAEHICTRPCGKMLSCGLHRCGRTCHRADCGRCIEASFDELSCNCGRTRIMPPVPCGTQLPSCPYPCTRPSRCSHPAVNHECHPDSVECPRCPYLTEKRCMCGKQTVKNVMCGGSSQVSCGKQCQRVLSCGYHRCERLCHSEGGCPNPCKQICGKPRKSCGHPCQRPCHAPFPCPEDPQHSCTLPVSASCACGTVKATIPCKANTETPAVEGRVLKCTEVCSTAQRNRQLREAFEIDPEKKTAYSSIYGPEILEFYGRNEDWCRSIEREFVDFGANDRKALFFRPMKVYQREFVHRLAEIYGFGSESHDPEPYRCVCIFKSMGSLVPLLKLDDAYAAYLQDRGDLTPGSMGLTQMRRQKDAYNGILLVGVRFGLTRDELESFIRPNFESAQWGYELNWFSDNNSVVLKPVTADKDLVDIEGPLASLKTELKRVTAIHEIADSCELCWITQDNSIAYNESTKRKGKNITASSFRPKAVTTTNAFAALELQDQAS